MADTQPTIDWGQLWSPGPRRVFTADEMARAGNDAPSPTVVAAAMLNLAAVAFLVLLLAPSTKTALLTGAFVGFGAFAAGLARWLWRHPSRSALARASMAVGVVGGAGASLLGRGLDASQRELMLLTILISGALVLALLWFLVIWRANQIEVRLREQAEREKAIEMARRLTAAQLEPHFLFNTLSSLQHWVQTGDARAAPLLDALTTFLRATLPLFDRPALPVADELKAVESYLRIMQARLGEVRLQWAVDVDADAARARIAPGLLLTLVENAVEHGVEPLLSGGRIAVHGTRQGAEVVFEVQDNGAGPAPEMADGVGLANARERLVLTAGPGARLTIEAGPEGGCVARVRLPYVAEESTP